MQGDRPFSDLNHGLSGWLDDTEKSVKSASSVAIRDLGLRKPATTRLAFLVWVI